MGYAVDLIKSILKLAVYLALTGQLLDQTRMMMFAAHKAKSQTLRLGTYNRLLMRTPQELPHK
jgi:hypothetical protein